MQFFGIEMKTKLQKNAVISAASATLCIGTAEMGSDVHGRDGK